MLIRAARDKDAEELAEIYAYYVLHTAVTFDYEAPDPQAFRARMKEITQKYPYIVAEKEGEILGFAYAGTFKNKAAYDWSVETTIYVKNGLHRLGVGRRLYEKLEAELKDRGIRNAYACISYTGHEDETLTNDSMRFHERMGYRLCGTFRQCGYKFGRWYDMIWMEKMLGDHEKPPK